jgi:hypothetical protein
MSRSVIFSDCIGSEHTMTIRKKLPALNVLSLAAWSPAIGSSSVV